MEAGAQLWMWPAACAPSGSGAPHLLCKEMVQWFPTSLAQTCCHARCGAVLSPEVVCSPLHLLAQGTQPDRWSWY